MELERDIEEDVKINRFKLDVEAETHPSIYYYYSNELAEAKKDRDLKKTKTKEITAKIELDYRADKIPFDGKKTEAGISSAVEIHPDVVKAKKDYIESEYIVNKLSAMEESIRQRKGMLDNLIQLYTMQYYAEPKSGRYNSTDQAGDELRKNLKRNKEV